MTKQKTDELGRILIDSLDEIPNHFDSEDDERDYWATHSFSERLLDSLPDEPTQLDLPERTLITSLEQVPHFDEELEAFRWWQTHQMSDDLYFSLEEGTPDFERIQPYAERRQRAERRKPASKAKRKVS
jgi:hypothetical protein